MGVLDKIKNALFEVEYVEVDEPPKKEKKNKVKEKKELKEKEEKPIAKKIVLPGKKEEKVEEIQEEELRDEDFEIRPKDESIKEKAHEEFKFLDDNDFKVEEEIYEEPEIVHVYEENEPVKHAYEEKEEPRVVETKPITSSYDSKPYGVDNSYNVPVHEYGTYERKEEKTYFKPSPIISPIYGILDKNYKKEDVREKKDVRLTSGYSRDRVTVDDIRDKAYGVNPSEEKEEDSTKFEVEEDSENLLVDLSDRAKPEVKELTMGDALEYFQDLGLEYNVDYVDASKEKENTRRIKVEEEKTTPSETRNLEEDIIPEKLEGKHVVPEDEKASSKVEDDNDNLFDLIDSMYQETN